MVIKELFARLGFEMDDRAFEQAEHTLHHLGATLAAVGAIAAGLAGAFFHETSVLTDLGFEIDQTSQKLGITANALQEMRHVARAAGLDAEALDHGMRHLSLTVLEASQGNYEAAYSLGLVGAHARDASGKLMPADKILESVAAKFAKMPDGVNKTALAMKVFGREGAAMIPVLNMGAAGIEKLRAEAHKFGTVMDADMIARAKESKKSAIELDEALEGLRMALVGPQLGAFNKIRGAITDWIIANRVLIAQGFQKFLNGLAVVGKVVVSVFDAIYHAVDLLAFSGIPGLIIVVSSLIAYMLIFQATAVSAGLAAAAAWIVAAAPVIAIIALIAAVILILDDLWEFLSGGKSVIGEYLVPAFHNFFNVLLPKWFHAALQWFKNFFHDMKIWALDEINDLVNMMLKKLAIPINWIKQHANPANWFGQQAAATGGVSPITPISAGGAASPAASAALGHRAVNAGLTIGDINITAPNADPKAIAGAVTQAIEDHHAKVWRNAAVAVGGAR